MAVNPFKILVFLLGCASAAVAVAYGSGALDPYFRSDPGESEIVAESSAPGSTDRDVAGAEPGPQTTEGKTGDRLAAVSPDGGASQTSGEAGNPDQSRPATEAGPTVPQVPSFDIVRVEPDGSVVVAGRTIPHSVVELLDGEKALGSDRAAAEGDFAIVLDTRLQPGDYQLTLRAKPPQGEAVLSAQTAVVSIPEKPEGQVLAMVEQPGKASDLIKLPEPVVPADKSPSEPEEAGKEAVAKPSGPTIEPTVQPEGAVRTGPADAGTGPAQEAPAAAGGASESEAEKPAETAAAAPQAEVAAAAPAPSPSGSVVVEAVEIDGATIYVAGKGEPGRFVRVYANELVIGEARVDSGGRFLIEAKRDLPVGNYTIRADMLDAEGLKVIARAAVPFEREPGEAIAAVAPPAEGQPASDAQGADASAPAPAAAETAAQATPDAAAPGKPAEQAAAPAELTEAGDAPGAGDLSAAARPAGEEISVAPSQPAPATEAGAPVETVSPKLQKVSGAVIIRRSDTLWRISRRVYGRGIRYWTIYLANQNQIADPNRIWPGQVFRVPEVSAEGETADLSKIGSQATTVPVTE